MSFRRDERCVRMVSSVINRGSRFKIWENLTAYYYTPLRLGGIWSCKDREISANFTLWFID